MSIVMIRSIVFFSFLLIVSACDKNKVKALPFDSLSSNIHVKDVSLVDQNSNTIKTRFLPPKDYYWINNKPNSFGYFIENFPLKVFASPILKYDGSPIATQDMHQAIFDIDVGNKDLQQCADAVIRLKAEYLYRSKQYDKIKFHFTSGDLLSWEEYKSGLRVSVNGNKVSFLKQALADDSDANFRQYLDLIFMYAGTISLAQYETVPVKNNADLKTGDILITAGSPGHVVFVAGVVENKNGERLYLLGQGFTPAQSIHILNNPYQPNISPWYQLDVKASETKTARYYFKPNNFRTFK